MLTRIRRLRTNWHRILIGYFLSYLSYLPSIHHFRGKRRNGVLLKPEVRLWWLLFLAPLETIGLFGFAWTSLGPSHGIPWIAPMIFSTLIAIANVSCPTPRTVSSG